MTNKSAEERKIKSDPAEKMLWGGRFTRGPSDDTIEFNSSENIELDSNLIPYDIIGSRAHAKMLEKQGIISNNEAQEIISALNEIYKRWKKGSFGLSMELEDVHMNIETAVTNIVGAKSDNKNANAGKKLHTARSRNDQIMLDMRLYMRDKLLDVVQSVYGVQLAFADLSKAYGTAPMASYTHTRVAQPITVSFWCEAWSNSLERDLERLASLYSRLNKNPLGACAISGTRWKIDRKITAEMLGFDSVQENELDTITSRGENETEFLFVLSEIMCKLSRISEELIWFSEKGMLGIAEEYTTGSSIMPNKKNPDVLELIRGRAGRVYGNLNHCLTSLKGLISGYHSDMQETKFAVMNGIETAEKSLNLIGHVISSITFDKNCSKETLMELEDGFAQATEIADYLAINGMPFREAHEKAGKLVKYCEQKGIYISDITCNQATNMLGLKIPENEWKVLISFERKRLERTFRPKKPELLKERGRIEAIYKKLL